MNNTTAPRLTPISEIGEFGLIDRIAAQVKHYQAGTLTGIGDDAAVLDYAQEQVLVSTDLLVEGIHFDLAYVPLKHLGYKAVAVNASDIYAMNGTPRHITVSLALSNRFPIEAVEELYAGIRAACETYQIDLVGGDTSSSRAGLVISVTVIGSAPAQQVVRRSGAQNGHLLCVTGDLGAAYAGLQLLEREKKIFADTGVQPQLAGWDYLIGRQLKPEARRDLGPFLSQKGILPSAMIDISDGLSSELLHLARHSGLGLKVFEDKLPIHPETQRMAQELNIDASTMALNGGEDYELLFAVDPKHFPALAAESGISIIGHFTSGPDTLLIARDGTAVPLVAQGWNHAAS